MGNNMMILGCNMERRKTWVGKRSNLGKETCEPYSTPTRDFEESQETG